MTSENRSLAMVPFDVPFYSIFLPFPIACFTLALLTDVAYWQTGDLLWQDFSSWLLFSGLVFGGLAVLLAGVDLLTKRVTLGLVWPLGVGGAIVLILGFANSLVHAGDGWTAVVPYGLILSAITFVAIAVTGWFHRRPIFYGHDHHRWRDAG